MKINIPITDGSTQETRSDETKNDASNDAAKSEEEKEGAAMPKEKNMDEQNPEKQENAAENPETKNGETAQSEGIEEKKQLSESELTDQLRRLAAEFDNYRKRNAGEYSRGKDAGIADAVSAILPAMDSIASALATAKNDHDIECLTAGVQAVERQILSGLSGLEVKQIEVKPGDDLDPNLHEVMLAQDSEDFEPGEILMVISQGYTHKDKLIRAAKVIVVKDKDN